MLRAGIFSKASAIVGMVGTVGVCLISRARLRAARLDA
jgi:hypothetical protein